MKIQLHHDQVKIYPNNARKYVNIIYPISISIDIKKTFIKIYYLVLILDTGQSKLHPAPRSQVEGRYKPQLPSLWPPSNQTSSWVHQGKAVAEYSVEGEKRGQGIYVPLPYLCNHSSCQAAPLHGHIFLGSFNNGDTRG